MKCLNGAVRIGSALFLLLVLLETRNKYFIFFCFFLTFLVVNIFNMDNSIKRREEAKGRGSGNLG